MQYKKSLFKQYDLYDVNRQKNQISQVSRVYFNGCFKVCTKT